MHYRGRRGEEVGEGGGRGGVHFQQLIDKCSAPPVFVDEDGNKTPGRPASVHNTTTDQLSSSAARLNDLFS